MSGLVVANRGEIALRIMRTAAARGLRTVALYSEDESDAPHVLAADSAVALKGSGPAAYLDVAAVCSAAQSSGATMVHPGYGFLSESPELADACADAGLTFVGPDGPTLRLLGDKSATRDLATAHSVPVLPATAGSTSVDTARTFATSSGLSSVIVKATAGGGGRGMRIVENLDDLARAMERCRSEAERSFGVPDVYVEAYLPRARHIEVQVVGDGSASPMHLFDRDCTGQRRHQKMVEIAPALFVPDSTRDSLYSAALTLASAVSLRGIATFEFLVDADRPDAWYFIEANPRIQVEHGVTEQITGLDLVAIQLDLADGRSLPDLELSPQGLGEPRGVAIEARITGGPGRSDRLVDMKIPTGHGLRIESHLQPGMRVGTGFDPLLAKVIASAGDFGSAATLLQRTLADVVLADLDTDLPTLAWYLASSAFLHGKTTTRTIDRHLEEVASTSDVDGAGKIVEVSTPTGGTVVDVSVELGTVVARGQVLVVVEAMKMESDVTSPVAGTVVRVETEVGRTVTPRTVLVTVDPQGHRQTDEEVSDAVDVTEVRPDVADNAVRHLRLLDSERPEAVERRHRRGKRTARENLDDLFDVDSFHEYGGLVVAAQRRRRPLSELESSTPADGLVTGFGTVAGRAVASLAYDYTVLAGTQGLQSHKKAERIFELAARRRTPVVVFAEGGGGRPGDTDDQSRATRMDLGTFVAMGRLNGVVPTVGIASGRCFAGNAALLGACDVVIATRDSSIGLGGPAMIEGGGLGSFAADDIGPASVQTPNGVIDILVDDEAQATDAAKRYLGYFQDRVLEWTEADQRLLRHLIPQRRHRTFEIREVIDTLADTNSMLELRAQFGPGMVTALIRVEGRPVGVVANDGSRAGGTIGSDEADKMARFLQLCEAFELPILSLCDTAGFLVGPDAERTATVRHVSRLFVLAPNLTVPFCTVIIRKAYGLGGQAMAGGSFRVPDAIVAWPTAALGAMGPEGAVKLGFRRELDAIDDFDERDRVYRTHLAEYEEQGKAVNAASVFEIDDVIDPAWTRTWLAALIGTPRSPRSPDERRRVDTW